MTATPSPAAAAPEAGGFVPPPYPYSRLTVLAERAQRLPGGMVDLSIGTPCDPPPEAVVAALGSSGTERGYPTSIGSPALRQAAAGWLKRRFGLDLDLAHIAACVGTKEMVATTAWFLRLRSPARDTVLAPATAYPTYAMSAQLAGCRAVAVPEGPDGGLDVSRIAAADAARALVLWANSPANPTGALTDLAGVAAWGRSRGVPVFSDECYTEFTWSTWPPPTILHHGTSGLVAVHSLSKRSNMAGLRVGFYAGDPEIVRFLSEIRQHAGLMVPGPVQLAAAVALDDDVHVLEQRARYRRRLDRLAAVLGAAGLETTQPDGAFYLWVPAPDWAATEARAENRDGAWILAEALADAAGMLVSPGEFYGPAGAGHVRIAMVQPDDRIELVARRLTEASDPRLGRRRPTA